MPETLFSRTLYHIVNKVMLQSLLLIYTMDYHKLVVSKQKEESISIQKVKELKSKRYSRDISHLLHATPSKFPV